jgi:hypothetical protein
MAVTAVMAATPSLAAMAATPTLAAIAATPTLASLAALLPIAAAMLVAAALALGGRVLGGALAAPRDSPLYRLALYALAGWLGLHLLLTALTLAGISWSPAAVLGGFALLVLLAWKLLSAPLELAAQPAGAGWGDGAAIAALAIYFVWALSLGITISDFVFHWGIKGHRFFLARGVDYPYLSWAWNWALHPDYPNLLPETYATTALAAGHFDERAMMLWSVIAFALLLAAARESLCRAGAERLLAQAALAALACTLAAYAVGGHAAGGADWLIALAMVAAMPAMISPADRRGAAQIGVIAAFAASSKAEGVPLAASLTAVYALRLWQAGRRGTADPAHDSAPREAPAASRGQGLDWRSLLALALPVAAAVVPWLVEVRHHHLFQAYNSGQFQISRAPRILAALAAPLRPWHGFQYGLLALPLLTLDRRLRAIAAVALLQLLFYLYIFFSVRLDPVQLIELSWDRLVMHLLPVALLGAAIALGLPGAGAARNQPAADR